MEKVINRVTSNAFCLVAIVMFALGHWMAGVVLLVSAVWLALD